MAAEKAEDREEITVIPDSPAESGSIQPRPSMVVARRSAADSVQQPEPISKKKVWHDLRNIVTPIEGYASLADHGCQHLQAVVPDPIVRQEMERIRDYLDKLRIGLDTLRAYFESQRPEVLDFSGVLEEVISCRNLVWEHAGATVAVEKAIPPGLRISGSILDLKQILCNLLNNAFEACISADGRKPRIQVTLEQCGAFIKCTICDNGCGIAPEVKDQVGYEGFTTKPDGHGLGLNLAICRLHDIGGSLEIINNSDRSDLKAEAGEKCGVSAIVTIPAVVGDQENL